MEFPELEDWNGIEVVQVKALELRQLHHLVSSYKKKLQEQNAKLADFAKMGKTPGEWNKLKESLEYANMEVKGLKQRLVMTESKLSEERITSAKLAKENDSLKVKLYDINTQLGIDI